MKAKDQSVSERTRRLIEFLDRNEAVLADIDEGVIILDLDGRAAIANPSAARLLDRPVREIMGREISALMGGEVKVNGQEQVLELRRDDKALLVNLVPIRDAWEQRICTVAVFHNLLQEAELDRARNDFVSLASHELRTPLNAVLGYIDMLKEDVYGPLTGQQRRAIERAAANTEQLVSLINNLLDQAHIQAGGLTLNYVPFSPVKLIDSVQTIMTLAARRKGLELTTSISDAVPAMFYGDFQRLCQIVINLVDNAVKFTDSGAVHVEVYKPDVHHWAVRVSDTGCGIPPEAREDVFVRFRQADSSMQREHRGAGLGLSIVRQLVDRMEGEIKLESEVGRGSTFTVVLPLVTGGVEGLSRGDERESVCTQGGSL
jgi:two-component system sensor histidine kinase ResE